MRAAQKKLTSKVAQKKGVIMVQNVYAKVIRREKTKVEKARKALERAKVAELKKENTKIATHKKLWKQVHKEFKTYLKARPVLGKSLK